MKLQVVIVDLELSPRVKKWGLRVGIPAIALLIGGVAFAGAPLPAFTSGEALTAANMNALVNAINALQAAQVPASGFSANVTALPYFPVNGTAVVFDSKTFDLLNEYNAGSGVFTAQNAGTYLFTCNLYWRGQDNAGTEPNGAWYDVTHLVVNGNDITTAAIPTTFNDDLSVGTEAVVKLAVGDQVTCVGNQEDQNAADGAAQLNGNANNNIFTGARVGG